MSESPAPPSAQVVAHEFVKQYYTMLNAAPDFLHRFYSHNSSFIHGEDQFAVTGQAEIHKKILSLNFDNCHARICQVDSQSSVSGSVVVQVIGELSNAGLPMRRFVQSFVLAPQTSNKYYVHVDIFRYQDCYVSVCDTDDSKEVYDDNQFMDNGELEEPMSTAEGDVVTVENDLPEAELEQQQEFTNSGCDQSEATIAATVDPELQTSSDANEDAVEEEVPAAEETVEDHKQTEVAVSDPVVDDKKLPDVIAVEKVTEPAPVETPAAPAKPLTWAAMASRNAGAPSVASPIAGSVPNNATPARPSGAAEQPPLPARSSRPTPASDERSTGSNGRAVVNGNNKDVDNGPKRPTGTALGVYPDNQQVFVGNLPQHLTDQELINFFEQYGAVLDFRINRKPGTSSAGNNLGQKNFGFMAFEKPETVEKVLAARPLYLGKHRLNIEEKKPKEELARSRVARFPSGKPSTDAPGNNYARPTTNGPGPRRGGREFRNDARSVSSDDGRTN